MKSDPDYVFKIKSCQYEIQDYRRFQDKAVNKSHIRNCQVFTEPTVRDRIHRRLLCEYLILEGRTELV